MKTIPSLVASSTVGIAAAGLALGKPEPSTSECSPSRKRKIGGIALDVDSSNLGTPSTISRPATSSTMVTPDSRNPPNAMGSSRAPSPSLNFLRQPSHPKIDSPTQNGAARRWSLIRSGDAQNDNLGEESVRDSVSSRGSWIRKLSLPISGNSSPRSSIAPESPSITFSHVSAVPILSTPRDSPTQLPPNKLVKRQTSERNRSGTVSSGSKSQVPTLRRPATSHQRSVTLQQRFIEDSPGTKTQARPTPPRRSTVSTQATPLRKLSESPRRSWRMYFDSRPTKYTKERSSGRSTDGNMHKFLWTSKRVMPDPAVRPTLVKPDWITISTSEIGGYFDEDGVPCDGPIDENTVEEEPSSPLTEEDTKEKRPRRSLSMHFSSPSTWITRTGSLRNKKRNLDSSQDARRHTTVPEPLSPGRVSISANGPPPSHSRPIMDPTAFQRHPSSSAESSSPLDPFGTVSYNPRNRHTSSPLPPLSRLSTFNVDLTRLGMSSSASTGPLRSPSSPFPQSSTAATSFTTNATFTNSSSSYYGSLSSKPRTSEVGDRASTLIGSDNDMRGFASGDDDDIDFQSETVYDSIRSGATSSLRSQNTPLDSMFDESPPIVNGHPSKAKRLSIHELMVNGGFGEIENKIVEEDEGQATPVKGSKTSPPANLHKPVAAAVDVETNIPSSPPNFSIATKEFSRLSLDDDEEDEDWTRDEDNENLEIGNQLSPPNNFTCRRVSPIMRTALADVTHSGSTNGNHTSERPKSNLFDWSEPSTSEKDLLGNSARPRTAHVKHLLDGRGGRTVGRKGPHPLHIRSQSVPVVPDLNGQREPTKLTPKFGTWGLGAKGVSEDWDNDFDFEGNDDVVLENGNAMIVKPVMLVPPAIQASQANVVGHVGQIREVCLLVEDLKRLRLLAREKDLINGPSAQLWKEAEGIIALAVPDEEDPTLSPPHTPSSPFPDPDTNDKFLDHGGDGEDLSMPDEPFEVLNRHGNPSGFVYDGHQVRRRSVIHPDDDIFGAGAIVHNPPIRDSLRPPSVLIRHSSAKTSAEVARTVMETMHQHRSTSDPVLWDIDQSSHKMPFDTTSLRDLVHRANVLSRKLSDIIREADGPIHSPEPTPQRETSPAFTRVFTDPMSSPPKHLLRSHSNNSMLSGSMDSSPTRSLGQRMHMMTVV